MEVSKEFHFPNEPLFFSPEEFRRLMKFIHSSGISDVTIQTEEPIKAQAHGEIVEITRRKINNFEVEGIVNEMYGSNGVGRLKDGKDIDCAYVIKPEAKVNLRFRVNMTPCYSYGRDGVQITARVITSKPRKLEDMMVDEEIIKNFFPIDGLVLVCGATGSGKSSLMSSLLAYKMGLGDHMKLITAESPIEYVYDEVAKNNASVCQSEVPSHLEDFAAAVRNALRRAPTHILIGEARDRETIEACLEASETGHTVYSTVHSDSVHGTLYRLVNAFPSEERSTKLFEIVEQLRMVVVQKLLRRAGGGRVACREYLVFSPDVRDALRSCTDPKEAVGLTKKLVAKYGRPMHVSAQMLYDLGLIEARELNIMIEAAKRQESIVE